MKRRYMSFYKIQFNCLPYFKKYGFVLTDKWQNCLILGLSEMAKGRATFFYFHSI